MMKTKSFGFFARGAILAAAAVLSVGTAIAAPPAGSPYFTDPQNSYVEDATSQGIGMVNMITCFMSSMRPADLVNQPNYIALVDQKKCNSSKSDASNQGASGGAADAPDYTRAIVNSTRVSNVDPMNVKIWIDDTIGNNTAATIFVGLSASQAPSSANPYGVFRLDFCGMSVANLTAPQCAMMGFLDASATGLQFFQNEDRGGGQTSQTQLALSQGSGGGTGSGRLSVTDSQNGNSAFAFAYNTTNYIRDDGSNNPVCFSRLEADADKSVWRYSLYDGSGQPVTVNSGFPVTWTNGGTTYQGQIGYYGLWMQDNQSVPDGATLVKQSFGQGASGQSFTLARKGGRLNKYVKQSTTLDAIKNMKLSVNIWVQQAGQQLQQGSQNFEMYWNGTQFVESGTNVCGQNGCQVTALNPEVAIANSDWTGVGGGVFGYSQTLNGQVRIADMSNLSGATQLAYRQQSMVYPGDMPASLYCLGECSDLPTMTNYFTGGVQTPWIGSTGSAQFNPTGVVLNALVAYDTVGGLVSAQGMNQPMVWDPTWPPSQQYQWGFQNGKMFDAADLALVECSQGSGTYCGSKLEDLPTYYVWETGPNAWNQFVALTTGNGNCAGSNDQYCRFDPPLQVTFSVPQDTSFGAYAGQQVVLQYGGYGNLWGIPGQCVDRFSNAVVSCNGGGNNIRFVPAFVIPFDAQTGVVTAGNSTYWVRWLDREIRFNHVNLSNCAGLPLSGANALPLPDGSGLHNPGVTTSTFYIGPEPTVTDAPRVIGGVIMY